MAQKVTKKYTTNTQKKSKAQRYSDIISNKAPLKNHKTETKTSGQMSPRKSTKNKTTEKYTHTQNHECKTQNRHKKNQESTETQNKMQRKKFTAIFNDYST